MDSGSEEEIVAVVVVLLLLLLVSENLSGRQSRSQRPRGKINRRKLPFVGIRKSRNPGGPQFALKAAQFVLDVDSRLFFDTFRILKGCFFELKG